MRPRVEMKTDDSSSKWLERPQGFGVRQPSGALESATRVRLNPKMAEDRRSPGHWREDESTVRSPGRNLWPAGIIGTFVLFIAGTVGLVMLSARNHVELVSPDYYERELRYQEQINRRERAQALPDRTRVSYDAAQGLIIIALPTAQARVAQGRIQLYRPSDARLDRDLPLALDSNGIQHLDAKQLHAGPWNIRVQWSVDGEEFFLNRSIVVPPGPS
jgi:hypothetical protein